MVIWMAARRVSSLCTPLLSRFHALWYPHPTQSLCLLVTPTPQILQGCVHDPLQSLAR